MPMFRCDYIVTSDLVLPRTADDLQLSATQEFSIILRNNPPDENDHIATMLAVVVGPAASENDAVDELRAVLASHLDLLSFATHSRFAITKALRQIDWEPHQQKRLLKVFAEQDVRYPPDLELSPEYATTVKALIDAPAFARAALKYFRYGLLERQQDDQFLRLWLALEIIAENVKAKQRIPIKCPACQAALRCEICGVEPTRVPMATQAIKNLIERIVGTVQAPEVSKRLLAARNGLMHGRSKESVEKECKRQMGALVDELAAVAWRSISSVLPKSETRLVFGHRDGSFANGRLVAAGVLLFAHTGVEPHPNDAGIPDAKVEIISRTGGGE